MDGEGISDGLLSAERRVEIRLKKNGRKVIVEKSAAEGLPEGWIKKLVITNRSGRKNRRDPFFIDPKSEYIFQSFKDASRYVETGDIGNYARKVKESDIKDDDSGNGENNRTMESLEKRSADDLSRKEKNINFYVRKSKMNSDLSIATSQVVEDVEKKEEVKDPIENQPIAKRVTRSQSKASKNEEDVDSKRKNPSSSNAKSEEDSKKSRLMSARSQDPEKESIIHEEVVRGSTEKRIIRSKAIVKKNDITNSVPRRSSKRLAGIQLEPTPELKTRTKAQRIVPHDDVTARKCEEPVSSAATSGLKNYTAEGRAKSYNELSSPKPNAAATGNKIEEMEKIGKPVRRYGSGDKKKKKMKMPLVISEAEFELNPVFQLDGYNQEEEMSPVSPLSRQIPATKREKTTPSKRLGRSSPKANKPTSPKATKISPLRSSNKCEHPYDKANALQRRNISSNSSSMSSVVARGTCTELMEKSTNSFSSAFDSTLADIWKDPCIAFAIETLTGESLHPPNTTTISSDPSNNRGKDKGVAFLPETSTVAEKPGVSSGLPCMDIWKDPCIDFAIKTLTGAIPIGLDEPDAKPKSKGVTREVEGKAKEL